MSFTSQYEDVHDRLGHARGPGVQCQRKPELLRDPITGLPIDYLYYIEDAMDG